MDSRGSYLIFPPSKKILYCNPLHTIGSMYMYAYMCIQRFSGDALNSGHQTSWHYKYGPLNRDHGGCTAVVLKKKQGGTRFSLTCHKTNLITFISTHSSLSDKTHAPTKNGLVRGRDSGRGKTRCEQDL